MLAIIIRSAVLVAVYGGLAVIAWRRSLRGRLAWGEAARRPGHTALLVAGARRRASEALRIVG